MHAVTTPAAAPAWRARVHALLDDPIARAVLRRDGLTEEDVLRVMAAAAARLRAAPAAGPYDAA